MVANGTFDTDLNGWIISGSGSAAWQSPGVMRVTPSGGDTLARRPVPLITGQTYRISVDVVATTGQVQIVAGDNTAGGIFNDLVVNAFGPGTVTATFTSTFGASAAVGVLTTSAAVADYDNVSVTLAMAGSTSLTFAASGALTGTGALSGATSLILTPAGTVIGRGSVTGSSSVTLSPAGTLSGRGILTGSSALVLSPSGTITGKGALTGASSLAFAPVGALSGLGVLSGSVGLSLTAAGSLSGAGSLLGSTALNLSLAGTLTTAAQIENITGTTSLVFSLTGTLDQPPLKPRSFVIRLGGQEYSGGGGRTYASPPVRAHGRGLSRTSRSGASRSYSSSRGR